ncbi:hypothetical protein QE152_g9430 [Popillia japonica]|uniref:Uncharacterized protein n=1 Tax=Popillia japonica TaxID=7064 RepID=A0AAW1LUU8_POPJA
MPRRKQDCPKRMKCSLTEELRPVDLREAEIPMITDTQLDTLDTWVVDSEKIKVVEKKTRVTDLVMNSKQVLSLYLMSDESTKYQEDWEEKNEKVIQVIELDYIRPDEEISLRKRSD